MASLMFSCVFVGPPHRKHTNHHRLSRSPSFKCQTITLTELWIRAFTSFPVISGVLLIEVTQIKNHNLLKEIFIIFHLLMNHQCGGINRMDTHMQFFLHDLPLRSTMASLAF